MPHTGNFPRIWSPLSIGPPAFAAKEGTYDYQRSDSELRNGTSLTLQIFFASVNLPPGVSVRKLTLHGYRTSAAAELELWLYRTDHNGNNEIMAILIADWSDGYGNMFEDTIAYPKVNNVDYSYSLRIDINPDASVADCMLTGATIEFS